MMLVSEHLFLIGALPLAEAYAGMLDQVKEPGFAQWVVYLIVLLYVVEKVGGGVMKLTGRELPVKRQIEGTLTTVPETRHADQSEVDELRDEVQSLREENQGQHNEAARAGQGRVQALSEFIDSRTGEIELKLEGAVKDLMNRMDAGFKELSKQLQDVSLQGARHDATLPHLGERITALTERYNEAIPSVHRRIDELTKAIATKGR
jgi:chromosome segregation ATPase